MKALDLNPFQKRLFYEVFGRPQTGEPRVIGIRGGINCGKTTGLAAVCAVIGETRPSAQSLYVMDSLETLRKESRKRLRDTFAGAAAENITEKTFTWAHEAGPAELMMAFYDMPAGADEARNPIESMNLHAFVLDEAQKLEHLIRRIVKHAVDRTRSYVRDLSGRLCDPVLIFNGRPAVYEGWVDEVRRIGGVVINASTYDNIANVGEGWLQLQRRVRTKAEFEAIIEGGVMPAEGAIYSDWSEAAWPAGNILDGWRYDPSRPTTIAVDFGRAYPSVLFIQTFDVVDARTGLELTLDVVFDELHVEECLTGGLFEAILEMGWPRRYIAQRPAGVPYIIDDAVVDPAGLAANVRDGVSEIDYMRRPPAAVLGGDGGYLGGGVGVDVHYVTDGPKRHINTGIGRVQRLILTGDGARRLVMSRQLFERSKAAGPGRRTLRRALAQYTWVAAGKAGKGLGTQADHPVDALRYYVVHARWDLLMPRAVAALTRRMDAPRPAYAERLGPR